MLIGKRLKELRMGKQMSLTDLSRKSGIQLATLSRMEHLKMTGTLESHMRLAKALEVELTELYRDLEKEKQGIDPRSRKAKSDVFVHNAGSSYEILTNNVLTKRMMPILLKIEPGGKTNTEQNKPHAEKFIYVLEGKVEVKVADFTYSLAKNSTLYFDASLKHQMINMGKAPAKLLCVGTPVEL